MNIKFLLKLLITAIIALTLVSCKPATQKNPAPLFDNIGNFHHPITTKSPLAQRYFDQGLTLLYSFEYGEAVRSFAASTQVDPSCAMCYWGLALSLGSKTNTPLNGHELKDAKNAIEKALKYVDKSNLSERLYISALATRYQHISPQKLNEMSGLCGLSSLNPENATNYLNAMKNLLPLLPNDPDVKSLYIAAFIDSVQWMFWKQDGNPYPQTLKAIAILENAIKENVNHPGANHFYIHIIEGSRQKAKALPSAIKLGQLVPVSEHMEHMPCHTYYSLGNYHQAVIVNQNAIKRFNDYAKTCKTQGFEPEPQFLFYHDYDFLISAASMEGNKSLSLNTAKKLNELITPWLKSSPFLQKMQTPYILMLARFGSWNEILNLSSPPAETQYVLAIWHYARALAKIELNKINDAKIELAQLKEIIKQGPIDKNLGNYGYTLLNIADHILEGLLAEKSKNKSAMVKNFNAAISLQDTLYYSDPPGWYFPVRELLGASFLRMGFPNEAKQIFHQDLEKNTNNPWSLYGLELSERALKNNAKASQIEQQFKNAWQYSDIEKPIYP